MTYLDGCLLHPRICIITSQLFLVCEIFVPSESHLIWIWFWFHSHYQSNEWTSCCCGLNVLHTVHTLVYININLSLFDNNNSITSHKSLETWMEYQHSSWDTLIYSMLEHVWEDWKHFLRYNKMPVFHSSVNLPIQIWETGWNIYV